MSPLPAQLQRLSSFLQSDTYKGAAAAGQGTAAVQGYAQGELQKADESEATKKLEALCREWYGRVTGGRAQYEQQWYKNLDMAQGRQFTKWDDNMKTMVPLTPSDLEPRLPVNVIEPVMRTELAKTGSSHPNVTVSPSSSDDEDVMAARAGDKVLQWFQDQQDFQVTIFNQANFWRAHTGMGYIKTYVDFSQVDTAAMEAANRAVDSEQATLDAAAGNSQIPFTPAPMKPKPIYGKICSEPISPFNLWVGDLLQPNLQKQPFVIHGFLLALETARMRYKDYLPEDWAPARSSAQQLIQATHIGIRAGNDQLKDQVLVLEIYVKPGTTNLLPQGGLCIMVGDTLVAAAKDGMPYEHGMYPFGVLSGIETGGFYRKSVVQSLTPIQEEINRIFAQLIKYKNMVIRPQMMYDEGSVDVSRVISKAGLWIPVRLGMKRPEVIQLQALPQAVGDLLSQLRQIYDDISGQHQVSRAQTPGANTAASALSLMQETDDNFLSPTFDSIELCMKHTGRFVLSNAQQFWDEPRYIKVVGEDSSVDAQLLRGADLEGGTDVRCETGSGLPVSKSARIAVVTDWMSKGFISPELGMKALEMGMLGTVYNLLRVDEDQATRENLAIEQMNTQMLQQSQQNWDLQQQQATDPGALAAGGQNPFAGVSDPALGLQADPAAAAAMQPEPFRALPVNVYDNDAVHADVHARMMKSQEFQAWPPERQQALLQHYQDHVAQAATKGIVITGIGDPQPAPQQVPPTAGYAQDQQNPAAPAPQAA